MAAERRYDVVTFDCYGTLIDWERGIRQAVAAVRGGAAVDLDRLIALYHEIEPAVEAERFRPYRDVMTETMRRVAVRLGWALPAGRAGFLAESLPAWPPFPDTNRGLLRLVQAGYELGLLSNVDDNLLVWSRRHLLAPFEVVVTAEQVRSYKPAPGHFLAAREQIGGRRWLHAARSYFHDVMPARALGIPTAWVNRGAETAPDGGRADREIKNLSELAEWLAP